MLSLDALHAVAGPPGLPCNGTEARQPRVMRSAGCLCSSESLSFGQLVAGVDHPLEGVAEGRASLLRRLAGITRRVKSERADSTTQGHLVGIELAPHGAVVSRGTPVRTELTDRVRSVGLAERRRR
jgi:hypothetical protein